jgi:hypothetical protein
MIRALCLAAIIATPATANVQCGKRDAVLRHLAQKYQEGVIGRGIAHGGAMVELLASPSGSWTMIATSPQGTTCLVATGTAWDAVPDILGIPG